MNKNYFLLLIILLFSAFIFSPLDLGVVTSNSMSPEIDEGEAFIFYDTNEFKEGDVIVFNSEIRSELVTHRAIRETEDGYITKGDNNRLTDQEVGDKYITQEDVVGRVLYFNNNPLVLPFLNLGILEFLNTNKNIILAFVLILIGFDLTILSNRKFKKHREIKYGHLINFFILSFLLVSIYFLYTPTTFSEDFVVNNQDVESNSAMDTVFLINPIFEGITTVQTEVNYENIKNIKREGNAILIEHGPYDSIGSRSIDVKMYVYPKVMPEGMLEDLHNINPIIPAMIICLPAYYILYIIAVVLLPINYKLRLGKSER